MLFAVSLQLFTRNFKRKLFLVKSKPCGFSSNPLFVSVSHHPSPSICFFFPVSLFLSFFSSSVSSSGLLLNSFTVNKVQLSVCSPCSEYTDTKTRVLQSFSYSSCCGVDIRGFPFQHWKSHLWFMEILSTRISSKICSYMPLIVSLVKVSICLDKQSRMLLSMNITENMSGSYITSKWKGIHIVLYFAKENQASF